MAPHFEPNSGTRPDASVLQDLGVRSANPADLIAAVKRGLPTGTFEALAGVLGVTEAALAAVTAVSRSTLLRRKRSGRLTSEDSEHVLRVARLLDTATVVFAEAANADDAPDDGAAEDAASWMRTSNTSLGGNTPLVYADTEIGAREVEDLIGRISYGVYS